MRNCRYLRALHFDCCDWSACVESDSWVRLGLEYPPPEAIARGTLGVFEFVQSELKGGAVCVSGTSFAFSVTRIDVSGWRHELLPLLDSFRQGKFWLMKELILVMTHRDGLSADLTHSLPAAE